MRHSDFSRAQQPRLDLNRNCCWHGAKNLREGAAPTPPIREPPEIEPPAGRPESIERRALKPVWNGPGTSDGAAEPNLFPNCSVAAILEGG